MVKSVCVPVVMGGFCMVMLIVWGSSTSNNVCTETVWESCCNDSENLYQKGKARECMCKIPLHSVQ